MRKKRDFSKIYSYSKLALFDKCQKGYYFNYLDPEIAPIKQQFIKPRDYKTKGQSVHNAITLFYYLPVKERTFDNLKECLFRSWFSEIEPDKKAPLGEAGGFKDLECERNVYLDSLNQLKNFFNLEKKNLSALFYIPTENIKKSFNDYEEMIQLLEGDILISGKFDRIDELKSNSLRVVDFKTGNGRADKFQLYFYKLLAELNFKKSVDVVSFYDLKRNKIIDYNVLNVDKKEIKEIVLKKVKQIKRVKKFLPKPSRLCNHCDFKEICPIFKKNVD